MPPPHHSSLTTHHSLLAAPLLLAAFLLAAPAAFPAMMVIDAGFENGLPTETGTWDVDTAIDTTRAHSGRASLRLSSKGKANAGGYYFHLDERLERSSNCAFSAWVYAEPGANVSAYISADDGKGRYTVSDATGTVEPGKWCELTGTVGASDWRGRDIEFRLIVRVAKGACWVDDIRLVSGLPATPGQVWPKLEKALHAAADKRVSSLNLGDTLALDARNAILVPDTARVETALPAAAATPVPAEGLLVFAIDAKADLDLTGSLTLEPDADLRPGLRVTVLSDDTVIAAPAVKAAPWKRLPTGSNRPGPAPDIRGERPPSTVPLAAFRMAKGRHYITIAGPHIRPGGAFAKLELRASERPAEKPLYTFGFLADTHLGFGRSVWGNTKLNSQTGGELEAVLRELKREGAAFAILGGDMSDGGRRSQFEDLARAVKRAGLPVYGCIGNHDTFRNSRDDIAETLPNLFPSGPKATDYAFSRPPLRFIVLDGSYWKGKDGKIHDYRIQGAEGEDTTYREGLLDWLRDTLAKDNTTPTIIISHYHMYLRGGISDVSGFNLGKPNWLDKKLMTVIDAAPNVVATMNGHLHYNTVGVWHGITSLQNPAFVEWSNAYRVCRVYKDRLEWEIRQIPNRGLIREGVVLKMAMLTALSSFSGDIAGTVNLAPRAPVGTVIDEGFEGDTPPDIVTGGVTSAIDTTRAHTGRASLRVTPEANVEYSTVAFDLDHRMDFNAAGEFSIWVYAEPGAKVESYISAQAEGKKGRHGIAGLTGAIEPGKWSRLSGKVSAAKWRLDERDVRLVIRVHGPCWIDDASMRATRPNPAK